MDKWLVKLALVSALLVAPSLALEAGPQEQPRPEEDRRAAREEPPRPQERRPWAQEERDEWQQQQQQQQQVELVQQEEAPRAAQQQVELQAAKGGLLRPFEQPRGEAEPYAFGYAIEGSSRTESGDSRGVVRGQYTLQGPNGASRVVDYVADHNGFRASIDTNEFGTEARAPASVALRSSQPLAEELALRQRPEVGGPQLAEARKGGGAEWALLPPPPAPAAPVLLEKLEQGWGKSSAQKRDEAPTKTAKAAKTSARTEPISEEPGKQLPFARSPEPKLPAAAAAQHRSGPARFESATAHRRAQPRPPVRAYQARAAPHPLAGYSRLPASPAQQYRRQRPQPSAEAEAEAEK